MRGTPQHLKRYPLPGCRSYHWPPSIWRQREVKDRSRDVHSEQQTSLLGDILRAESSLQHSPDLAAIAQRGVAAHRPRVRGHIIS
jgi:hypothetical protein